MRRAVPNRSSPDSSVREATSRRAMDDAEAGRRRGPSDPRSPGAADRARIVTPSARSRTGAGDAATAAARRALRRASRGSSAAAGHVGPWVDRARLRLLELGREAELAHGAGSAGARGPRGGRPRSRSPRGARRRAADILRATGARASRGGARLRAARRALGGRAGTPTRRRSSRRRSRSTGGRRERVRPRGRSAARRGELSQLPQRRNSTVGLPARCPRVDAAVDDRHARRSRAPTRMLAAIAARGPVSQIVTIGLSRGRSASHRARAGGTGCSGCPRCSRCRARPSRGRRSARRRSARRSSSSLDGDELERLRAAAEHVAGDVEEADRAQPADRLGRLAPRPSATTTAGSSSSTNAAFVEKRVPETGTLSAPA